MRYSLQILIIMLFSVCAIKAQDSALKLDTLCKDIPIQNISKVPNWRNTYTITKENPKVYFAPNFACVSNIDTSLEKGNKIEILESVIISGNHSIQSFKNDQFFKIAITNQKESTESITTLVYIAANDVRLSVINFDFYFTLMCMVGVLILGRWVISKINILQDYNIPEPVVGGIIAAIGILIIYKSFGLEFKFNSSLKDPLMLAFFTSIGLSADFASLKKGGKLLALFLVIVIGLLILQNIIGIGAAYAMGINPVVGILSGSITMSGGHGTGVAWANEFIKEPYSFSAAIEVAMACATFGLIIGGIIGGPVARFLIKTHNLKIPGAEHGNENPHGFETPTKERLITPISFVESLALIIIALVIGSIASDYMKDMFPNLKLPTFVYCLFTGVILRNVLSASNIHKVFDREVSVLGNVSLSLFLAFAMMSVNLWELVALALPLIVILSLQATTMALYAIFITFRLCGKDYDAAVLAAGHCGFGLGATPTAMVNIQTVTRHYGPSHTAFLVVPLVGAFFIDLINALVIQGALWFLPF